jgi:prophage regulatory protein
MATQHNKQQPTQFYRLHTIKQRLGVSGSTIWSWIKQGKFPRGIKLSPNCTVWDAEDIEAWAQSRIAASK